MVRVSFKQAGIVVGVPKGTTILEAARKAEIFVETPCNGRGTCGKCLVKLSESSLANVNQKGKGDLFLKTDQGYVLACQTIITGNIVIESIRELAGNIEILHQGENLAAEKNIYITKKYNRNLDSTVIYAEGKVLGAERGNTERWNFGVVIDIGTTTLVVSLVDINTGKEVGSVAALNPQATYGQDVLSRIHFAAEKTGLAIMYTGLIQKINNLFTEVTKKTGVNKQHIYEVIFSGNTCMLHLATNISPVSMGKYPYKPAISGGSYLKTVEYNLDVAEFGLIYLPPVISAYVGADITSGILACQLHHQNGIILFIDIGTNGEMVLAVNGKLFATSTAAGPAFEGMNITHGMRAGAGAIELFEILDRDFAMNTIGGGKIIGICGSGLLDIVAELFAHGVIDANGKLKDPATEDMPEFIKERLVRSEGKLVFKLTEDVWLSQKDIRQVQLAKGAIRSGIELLLRKVGISPSDVDRVLIAGSFGYHLRVKSLINLGLLPDEFATIVEMVGNTSKSGGQAFLTNQSYRRDMAELVKRVEVIELADYQDFNQVFVKCLRF